MIPVWIPELIALSTASCALSLVKYRLLAPSFKSSVVVRASPTILLAEIQSRTPLPVVRRTSLDTPALVGKVSVYDAARLGAFIAL